MRYLFSGLLITFLTFGLSVNEASAKRFGGGGFGMMRSKNVFSQAPRATKSPTAARSNNSSRFRGALSGLLLGSLLATLFMGHGFFGAIFSWLFLGGIIYLVINIIRRKSQSNVR